MNGTTTRAAVALTLIAALAAPGSAMAAKKKKRAKKSAPVTIVLKHDYDAGGNGAGPLVAGPGVRINLYDPVGFAVSLGNDVLGQLGLPPVQAPALPGV